MWTVFALLGILIVFVLALILIIGFRKYSKVKVSCWFCNTETRVSYQSRNCWDCPQCDQYNGFTETGDYNKSIPAMYDERLNSSKRKMLPSDMSRPDVTKSDKRNGLCSQCNQNQILKVKQLSGFVPSSDNNYDKELSAFRQRLESIYALCFQCQEVVRHELHNQAKKYGGITQDQLRMFSSPISGNSFSLGGKHSPAKSIRSNTTTCIDSDFSALSNSYTADKPVKVNRRKLFRRARLLVGLIHVLTCSSLWLSNLNNIQIDSQSEVVPLGRYLPGILTNGGLCRLYSYSGYLAIFQGIIEVILFQLGCKIGARYRSTPIALWGLLGIAQALSADQLPFSVDRENWFMYQLTSSTVVLLALFAGLLSALKHMRRRKRTTKTPLWSPNSSAHSSRKHADSRSSRHSPSSILSTPWNRGEVAAGLRQRRDTNCTGGVSKMLSELALGRSIVKREPLRNDRIQQINLESSKFQISRPASTLSFSKAAPLTLSQSFSGQSSAYMAAQSPGLLWPPSAGVASTTNRHTRSILTEEDAESVLSSASHFRRYVGDQPEKSWTTTDWLWRALFGLVLLGSVSTNAAVLYVLITRT